MREIKFRAWDKKRNELIHLTKESGFSLQFRDDTYLIVSNIGNGETFPYCFFEDCILMQYTGLKDKNGKEIYEGDIFDMGVVIFDRGCFNGCYISHSGNERGWDYSDGWEDGLYDYARNHKIKGNIFENPELLKA